MCLSVCMCCLPLVWFWRLFLSYTGFSRRVIYVHPPCSFIRGTAAEAVSWAIICAQELWALTRSNREILTLEKCVSVTSNRNRILEVSTAPTKAKSREPAYSQALIQNNMKLTREIERTKTFFVGSRPQRIVSGHKKIQNACHVIAYHNCIN